MHQWSVVYL